MKYACPPLRRKDLKAYAQSIRTSLKLENTLMFPVTQFLEALHLLIADDDFSFQSIADEEWDQPQSRHAYFDLNDKCIYIKESVYNSACAGNGRDRMTIIHECAHVLLLQHSHLTLARSFSNSVPPYCDPEWQAKCLAGELMIPIALVHGMSAAEVSEKCGVSLAAAKYQLGKYQKKIAAKPTQMA